MGTIEIFLCIFVGHFITAQSVINEQDYIFPQDFPGFFGNMPFLLKRPFDFTPYDTIFSSRRTRTPDFHMLAELPPIMNVPSVDVFCDESKLTLLVDKRSNRVLLTGEEIWLGDGCYSNKELPNQFVFTYSLDECGTSRVMQDGLSIFTNSLHIHLKNPPPTWWPTPSVVHISCIPKRTYAKPNLFALMTIPANGKTFSIKAMNPTWTNAAESNIYKRGQVVNLQVSAKTRPEQQLFIQTCFVSASPEPQTRPRHAIIMNKGCTAPLGSPNAVVQFVASNRADVVHFVLNTSYLISELYIHCSVLLSDQGVTFGSKSCNYDVIQSRWEDVSGTVEVCECCSSKCKGLSVRHLSEDAKAVVSTGPLVIADKDVEPSPKSVSDPQETSSDPVTDSLQSDDSDGAANEDTIVSGTSMSRSKFSSRPQGVMVVSQDPDSRLTLWLPGQVQDTGHGENVSPESEDNLRVQFQASDVELNDLPELQPSGTDQESALNNENGKTGDQNMNFLTLLDGWMIPPRLEKIAFAEDPQIKQQFVTGAPGADDGMTQREAGAAVTPKEGANDARPVIHSKLEFSKGMDGSQTLSYEEELVKQEAGGLIRRFGMDGIKEKQVYRQRGPWPTFLDLLRRMAKAE